jgi:hypothetical protein
MYSIQHYAIKFVSDLQQFNGFLWYYMVSSTNKTDCHDITEILLKVALNTIPAPFIAILLSSTWIYQVTCSNKSSVLDINKKLLQYQQYVSSYCRKPILNLLQYGSAKMKTRI